MRNILATLNTAVADPILGYPPRLRFSNGYVQASFTRAAVRFMLKELDLTEMVKCKSVSIRFMPPFFLDEAIYRGYSECNG